MNQEQIEKVIADLKRDRTLLDKYEHHAQCGVVPTLGVSISVQMQGVNVNVVHGDDRAVLVAAFEALVTQTKARIATAEVRMAGWV